MNLGIVVASTRPSRVGPKLASWFLERAEKKRGVTPVLLDLKTIDLPVFDEANHPRLGQYEGAHTVDFAQRIHACDAFVIVTPEYNHSAPSSLVNAVTYLGREWHFKPVATLSYGGVSGGLRAVQQLKLILLAVKAVPIAEAVVVPFVGQQIRDGEFQPNDVQSGAADDTLNALLEWHEILSAYRAKRAG